MIYELTQKIARKRGINAATNYYYLLKHNIQSLDLHAVARRVKVVQPGNTRIEKVQARTSSAPKPVAAIHYQSVSKD